jgi:TraM recognition site of TraD and TraG
VTLVRGSDIAIWLGRQAASQHDALYKRGQAWIIMHIYGTKTLSSGADLEKAKGVSESPGDRTIGTISKSHTKGKRWGKGVMVTKTKRTRQAVTDAGRGVRHQR